MIGNDIVDWAQAKRESNWQRRGFLAKLFTREEQQLIHDADKPEQMVWTLWSLKESVYKAHVRQTGKRLFAPQKIVCQLNPGPSDKVDGIAFYDQVYQIRASLTPEYVAGVAFLKNSFPVQEVVISFDGMAPSDQSAHLYQRIREASASVLAVPIHTICLRKNENSAPSLLITYSSNEPITIPVSISHHGRYGAFVIDYSRYPAASF